MTCDEFKDALHAYFTGELPIERRDDVDRHYRACEDCGHLMKLAREMTCKDFVEFLNDYLDGELSPERKAMFERHLSICPDCTAYLQSYRATMMSSAWAMKEPMGDLGEKLPPEMVQAILEARRKK